MAATADERAEFARTLRSLRNATGMTQKVLALHLTDATGEEFTGAAVSYWETGQGAPKHRSTVAALDEILDGHGQLLDTLGVTATDDDWRAGVEARLARIEAAMGLTQHAPPPPPVRKPRAPKGATPRAPKPAQQRGRP